MTSSITAYHASLTIDSHHPSSHHINQRLHTITSSKTKELSISTSYQSLRMQFVSKVVLALAVISNAIFAAALPQVLPSGDGPSPEQHVSPSGDLIFPAE